MRKIRFHIASVVILILLVAVCLAALRESNQIWDSSVFSITLGTLFMSILLTIYRLGPKRAFWLGFALAGWTYLGLTLVPSIESRLITSKALVYFDSKVPRSLMARLGYFESIDSDNDGTTDLYVVNSQTHALIVDKGNGAVASSTPNTASSPVNNRVSGSGWLFLLNSVGRWMRGPVGSPENFVRIGHSLFALVIAVVVGQVSRQLYAKNRAVGQDSVIA
jgi:hypothetical protein